MTKNFHPKHEKSYTTDVVGRENNNVVHRIFFFFVQKLSIPAHEFVSINLLENIINCTF